MKLSSAADLAGHGQAEVQLEAAAGDYQLAA